MQQAIPLAAAVAAESMQAELGGLTPLATFRGLLIFSADASDIPSTMQEIGRIREAVFRQAGAGRNLPRDLDDLDYTAPAYQQLLVWDPERLQLVAMYRYQLGWLAADAGLHILRTSQLFRYSEAFRAQVLPYAIELGRSVVNPAAAAHTLGFFALWLGLGALLRRHPRLQYFFGNVTLYPQLGEAAMQHIVQFCQQLYPPPEPMLQALPELLYRSKPMMVDAELLHSAPSERIKALQYGLQALHCRVPPVLQSYLSVGNGIWFDDAALDLDFGAAYEQSIIVPLHALSHAFRQRFLDCQL
ncbi:GNAT family N-acetyltransferase [Alishewanella sp. BS5-314]|uniref:GNAT family N-acetyltransferase n=1 Tax=Alishewanella sp. BS5-314 TaxID=2755587 RepID=UPI0021BA6FDE|nr:GNAT family N-acetyltransferase [Alishewanella sp. BS5-314]MCT8125039.1 GNAT family N-acetyltransferase [Alishewanella sp. BS5-314]